MEKINWFDVMAGFLAIAILIGGLTMLIKGMLAFEDPKK